MVKKHHLLKKYWHIMLKYHHVMLKYHHIVLKYHHALLKYHHMIKIINITHKTLKRSIFFINHSLHSGYARMLLKKQLLVHLKKKFLTHHHFTVISFGNVEKFLLFFISLLHVFQKVIYFMQFYMPQQIV